MNCKQLLSLLTIVHTFYMACWCLTYDTDCFNDTIPEDTKSQQQQERAFVTITQTKYTGSRYETLSTKNLILKRGEKQILRYTYPAGFSAFYDYNPRNLTLLFDGNEVRGAIGNLQNKNTMGAISQSWGACQTSIYSMEYFEDTNIRTSGSLTFSSETLSVSVGPPDTPTGPDYDNQCTAFKQMLYGGPSKKGDPKSVTITHLKHIGGNYDINTVLSEQNIVVDPENTTILEFKDTVAESDHGFRGQLVEPRNLSLWINSTGHVNMAVAYLLQQTIVTPYGTSYEEKWRCNDMELDDEGNFTMYYCGSSKYSTISYINVGYYDVIVLKAGSFGIMAPNAFIVCIPFILSQLPKRFGMV